MLLVTFFLAAVLPDVAVFFPSPLDKDGWGLRVDKSAPSGTRTLVNHSIDGTPWTQENQDSYDFRHNIAPAPRPKP